ncbi:type II secretion system protein N [Sphingomonas soli]|uniref:type II secretion system protein N n=1 Tax=Sphingomonas soli TaxID=266127 RepID=UPI001FE24023|nr:type II secretion system protein N [Sphingomonas soli]
MIRGTWARRRIIVFVVLGIAAYVLAILATMPASVIVKSAPWRTGVTGTVWNGEFGVAGGTRIEWRMAPLRSLTSLAFAADFKGSGPDTDLTGRILIHPGGRTVLDNVSGSANASLLRALQPGLPFTCDMAMQVELKRVAIGGGSQVIDGTLASDPGACRPKARGPASAVPALILTAEHIGNGSRIRLAPMTQRRKLLMDATLAEDGTLDIGLTPDGSATLPFTGLPAGVRIKGQM